MRWADGFIAVDWGTTNRRAYRLDSSGSCVAEFEDGQGVLSVSKDGFPAAISEIRKRLGDDPLLLGGMIGSNRGWVDAPYVPCPAGLDELVNGLVWPDSREVVVPGVSYVGDDRADVMRGEEVQLVGAIASAVVPADALVCHPGTHNKWVAMQAGRIASFRTVMTGELFNLLKRNSILADLLQGEAEAGEAFKRGVRHSLDHEDLLAELFAVRARVLLGEAEAADAPSYASGVLIGADVRIGIASHDEHQIFVMGRPELTRLYAAAIREAGREPIELDGEQSFLSGAKKIAERISN